MKPTGCLSLLTALLLGSQGGWATVIANDPSPEPGTYTPPAIRQITVLRQPSEQSGRQPYCRSTRIDARRAGYFLNEARAGSEAQYRRDLLLGDCHADLRLRFADGQRATLTIDNATGWGVLSRASGETYLYCPACEGLLELDFAFSPSQGPR